MVRVVTGKNYPDIFRGKTNEHIELVMLSSNTHIGGRLVCFDDTQCTIHDGVCKQDFKYCDIAYVDV